MDYSNWRKIILIIILGGWIGLSIYVSFFQRKILLVGDWPHDYFRKDYGKWNINFCWAPSFGYLRIYKKFFKRFHKTYIFVSKEIIEASKVNKSVFKDICSCTECIFIEK